MSNERTTSSSRHDQFPKIGNQGWHYQSRWLRTPIITNPHDKPRWDQNPSSLTHQENQWNKRKRSFLFLVYDKSIVGFWSRTVKEIQTYTKNSRASVAVVVEVLVGLSLQLPPCLSLSLYQYVPSSNLSLSFCLCKANAERWVTKEAWESGLAIEAGRVVAICVPRLLPCGVGHKKKLKTKKENWDSPWKLKRTVLY